MIAAGHAQDAIGSSRIELGAGVEQALHVDQGLFDVRRQRQRARRRQHAVRGARE